MCLLYFICEFHVVPLKRFSRDLEKGSYSLLKSAFIIVSGVSFGLMLCMYSFIISAHVSSFLVKGVHILKIPFSLIFGICVASTNCRAGT